MTDEPAVEEVLILCMEHVTRASGTDCQLSMKAIRRRLKEKFNTWSNVKASRQADIAIAVLIDLKIIRLFYHLEDTRIGAPTNPLVHTVKCIFVINSLELIRCLNQS